MVLGGVLFWLLGLELANILLDRTPSPRKVPRRISVCFSSLSCLFQYFILISSRFIWGGVLMCHAATQNYAGLVTARFFLGVGEAAVAPGFGLLTGMFYKREEQPARYVWSLGKV